MADETPQPEEGMTPEQIYNFFKEMPVADLEKLAKEALISLDAADTREEAETAVIKMAPFFLDCTFPRLPESMKAKLRKCLDDAEEKHGSLAAVLGLDGELEGEEGDEAKPEDKK
jgi:ABC-type phosphate/phosphonate transport system substrate-binding protein